MHSLFARGNALLTTASTVLFVICALSSFTGTAFSAGGRGGDVWSTAIDLFHEAENVEVMVELSKVDRLKVDRRSKNDQVMLSMVLDADLRGVFTWNTKQLFLYVLAEYETPNNKLNQVVLWDAILTQKESAKLKKRLRQKYAFDDDGQNLRNLDFNITVGWNVMPKVGRLFIQSKTFSHFQLPAEYTSESKS